jgi:hypothetical protein
MSTRYLATDNASVLQRLECAPLRIQELGRADLRRSPDAQQSAGPQEAAMYKCAKGKQKA